MAFILALVVRITNSIFSSVIIHFIFNATSITMQKLLSIFAPDVIKASQQAESLSLINMPIGEKLIMIAVYTLMTVAFGTLVWLILKYLQKRNPETLEDDINLNADGTVEKEPL